MSISIHIWNENSEFSIDALLQAASISHNQPINSIDWFRWKYLESPYGEALIIFAKDENSGKLAGMLAFGKYKHRINGETLSSALSYETFVTPSSRGKGVFTKLINFAINQLKIEGVDFIFNFPNSASLPGFLKTGWNTKNLIEYRIKFRANINTLLHLKDIKKPFYPIIEKSNQNLIDEFCNNVETLTENNSICALRTKEYFKWRYLGENKSLYVVIETKFGKGLFRKGKRGGLIEIQLMEANVRTENYSKFVKTIFNEAKNQINFDFMGVCLSRSHPLNSIFKNRNFIKVPSSTNFTFYPLNKSVEQKLKDFEWMFTSNEFHMY